MESKEFYQWGFLDAFGAILFGMGLFKLGVFSAARSNTFYWRMVLVGSLVGLPLNVANTYQAYATRLDPIVRVELSAGYDLLRVSLALAYVGLVMLAVKADRIPWLTRHLASGGQMALSNYLLATVICTTLFNGHGFGLYGKVRFHEAYFVVAAAWAFQLLTSAWWLRYFQFGPVEWVWRSLTYWRRQPLLRPV